MVTESYIEVNEIKMLELVIYYNNLIYGIIYKEMCGY